MLHFRSSGLFSRRRRSSCKMFYCVTLAYPYPLTHIYESMYTSGCSASVASDHVNNKPITLHRSTIIISRLFIPANTEIRSNLSTFTYDKTCLYVNLYPPFSIFKKTLANLLIIVDCILCVIHYSGLFCHQSQQR